MPVTKKDFQAYLKVQKSGITNMFAVNTVCQLSGLNKEEVFDIMHNYETYEKQFGIDITNISH